MNKAICESLEHLKPWMPFAQRAPTLEESEEHCRRAFAQFILRENMTLSIYSKDGKTFLGSTGLHMPKWEIPAFSMGYWIGAKFEGRGLVSESTNALTRYAFQALKAKRLEIRCDSKNTRSLAVMKRLGFVEEGVFRNEALSESGTLRDTIVTARYSAEGLPGLSVSW